MTTTETPRVLTSDEREKLADTYLDVELDPLFITFRDPSYPGFSLRYDKIIGVQQDPAHHRFIIYTDHHSFYLPFQFDEPESERADALFNEIMKWICDTREMHEKAQAEKNRF